ncbi:MAG: MutS protein msh4 [Thelocarpon superellum]|nr:MAG: MutS protein msh4 [Thelocarpon superellum]
MAQIGCFVPARYASFPIVRQLFTRVSMDDSIEANVSTFAAEMRETAFILSHVDRGSMVIIDELGRGTSTRDGLAIALSVAEALALVWFATHFRDLAEIMSERTGVVNLHLAVEMNSPDNMTMLYKISEGYVTEQHYGLALARIVDFPASVLAIGTQVSCALTRQVAARKRSKITRALAKRRRLVLSLRETLNQARDGALHGTALIEWLRKLQREFVVRMAAIDEDMEEADDDDDMATSEGSLTETVPSMEESEMDFPFHHPEYGAGDRSISVLQEDTMHESDRTF